MAKNLKPYTVPLDVDLAAEILSIPVPRSESMSHGDLPLTIGERVVAAVAAIEEANQYLARSKLAAIVADTVMRKLKKRGTPSIQVEPDGTVILQVSYEEEVVVKVPRVPVKQSKRKSNLPTLDELREQAKDLGVDIDDLGRARRAIYERLQVARAAVLEDDDILQDSEEDPKPPARLVDERRESAALPEGDKPKVTRRRKGEPDKVVDDSPLPPEIGEEVDVDKFLDSLEP